MAEQPPFVELTTEIVAAYVANNSVPVAELPALLSSVHAAIAGLNGASAWPSPRRRS
uniref:MucR family transcriptional regulator n=1 Tax=Methylobacterium sp. B34 TaxID=95563 RepID=UPI0035E3CB6F